MLYPNPGHGVVLGSRVAVPIAGDFYAAATVQAVRNDVIGNEFVTVKFDDNNKGECPSSQIVGNGFKSIHDIKLHKNQKVFTTHNGREVVCSVEEHSDGQVLLNLVNSDKSLRKREEDIRLVENRFSPRLQDHNHDPDYRRIASENASPNHGKKRTVSASIEVPKPGRPRKWSTEPSMDELMAAMVLSNLSSSPVFHNPRSPTGFFPKGSSPHSFGSSGVGSWGQDTQLSPVRGEPMSQTLGIPVDQSTPPERTRSVIQHTHSIEHSPSSTGDPIEVDTSTAMDTSVPMEEDDNNDNALSSGVVPPGHSTPAPFQSGSPSGQYQAAQGSSPSHNPAFLAKSASVLESVKEEPNDKGDENSPNAPTYEQPRVFYIPPGRPEYMVHLPMVDTPPPPLAPADDRQYRELLGRFVQYPQFQADVRGTAPPNNAYVYIGSPSSNFYIPGLGSSAPLSSNLTYASAPRAPSPLAARNDRDTPPYQGPTLGVRSHPIKMPTHLLPAHAQPINIPGMKAFSWHTTGAPQSSPTPSIMIQRQHMHKSTSPKMPYTMPPKTLPSGRKVRGDGKKCRKVYGMENRDMWCTACRWKKACQRFPD